MSMSTQQTPFTETKKQKFRELYSQQLLSLSTAHLQSKYDGDDIISWLASYALDEQFNDINTIRQDLTDPQYSAIKSAMQSQFNFNHKILGIITHILLNDILCFNNHNHHRTYTQSSTLVLNVDEESKVFYGDKRRESDVELCNAFIYTISGDDNANQLLKNTNPKSDTQSIHSHRTSHMQLEEISPNPHSFIQYKSNTGENELISPPSGAYNDLENLKFKNQNKRINFHLQIPPQLNRLKTSHKEEDVIEEECVDNDFPLYLNVALFHRSDDESLELLIDKAVLQIFYGEKFRKLWTEDWFVRAIYSDKLFPNAVDKVFTLIDDCEQNTEKNKLGFIGSFVAKQFKRQINQYKRQIEKGSNEFENEEINTQLQRGGGVTPHLADSMMNSMAVINEKYFVYFYENTYIIQTKNIRHSYGEKLMTLSAKENVNYSWAVWKVSGKLKNDSVRSKGYWEVVEKESDDKRCDKMWKLLEENAGGVLKLRSGLISNRSKLLQRPSTKQLRVIKHTVSQPSPMPLPLPMTKKSKFLYIPLVHLYLMYELMKFHYHWSIQSEIAKKEFEKTHTNILDTPLYMRYCTHNRNKGGPSYTKEEDMITIEGIRYTLVWWNNVGQRKCNAFCIKIGDTDREYYYLRFRHSYERFRWDWYDNDRSRYERYSRGANMCVYKELEASFQGNIDENFPKRVFSKGEALYSDKSTHKHMFDICILPQLKKTIQIETGDTLKQGFVLRFTFNQAKANRITNIEQLSIHKDTQPFPRNVRRLIDNKNTIYFYFQSTDEYIEEWKKRYKLSTDQQQRYFFSFILCICAVMKYIECEFAHQMISFPYKKSSVLSENVGVFDGCLDDSDVQRHRRDFELWSGFFIPPEHQFQTSQIDKHIDGSVSKKKKQKKNVKAWYKSLAIVEPLKRFIYARDKKKNKSKQILMESEQSIFCSHKANEHDTLWLSNSTQDVYCNRCGVLLQFSECIRKYVLETENNEVIDFLWPWYRNFFHRRDFKKYHTSVAKYNLTYLFRIEDVFSKQQSEGSCSKTEEKSVKYSENDEKECEDISEETHSVKRTQIRHFRKFAAHILLGGWDILRNLNVIRNQLQCIFGSFPNEKEKELSSIGKWKQWKEIISKCNAQLRNDLDCTNTRKLMELHHGDQLSMNNKQQSIFSHLIDVIFTHANIYDSESDSNDGFSESESDSDYESDLASSANGIDSDKLQYYIAFKQSWKMVPDWWCTAHDKLLLELALKFNWDKQKYKQELTHPSKKQYYQVLLSSKKNQKFEDFEEKALSEFQYAYSIREEYAFDDESEDEYNEYSENEYEDTIEEDEDYVGYQEFQVWCENWRNIQHRLRYLSFIISDYFYRCTPSMVKIRIPDERHQIEQYKSKSIVFLNGYMEHVCAYNCKEELIDLNNIQERNNKLKKIEMDLLHKSTPKMLLSIPSKTPMASLPMAPKQSRSSAYSRVLNDGRARKVIHGHSSKGINLSNNNSRIRDPFLTRDLSFELEQICMSFDLLEYGTEIATFLIVLLKRKQLQALWNALGIVLEYMPYEHARQILESNQEALRHGQPSQLKNVCDRIMRGSNFSVHIALFLAEYMEDNSKCDLARYKQWMKYSKSYESEAGSTINTIESNHLLAVLLDIPLTYSGGSKVSLLQVALEQNRAEFLNNERINAVMAHVWQSPSGLAPDTEIIQANDSFFDIFAMLFDKPYHFYMTPMGFNATIKTLHLLYLLLIFVFIAQRQYLYTNGMTIYEAFLWSLNIGYVVYECIEAYDKGIRGYLSLAGWVNYWDICICLLWISLFFIRVITSYVCTEFNSVTFQTYLMLWAIATASLSARSLVLFQTSEYFGVLLRMLLQLMAEMTKFMFVLGLLLAGFVFGLYYIQGGYELLNGNSITLEDWYESFKYLFQLTVGAGDFSELNDIADKVTAQIFVIFYLILAAILMMNLLIALLTTTYEMIHISAKTASSFAFAESTYDLSHRSRFMPAPLCIYIFFFAALMHVLNFIPAILSPKYLNIYNCVNHYQYQGFDTWRMTKHGCLNCKKIYNSCVNFWTCLACKKRWLLSQDTLHRTDHQRMYENIEKYDEMCDRESEERCLLCCCNGSDHSDSVELKVKTEQKTYKLITRGRVCKYYLSTVCCCYYSSQRFEIYHTGCYSCIPTALGAKEKVKDRSLVNGITLNQYAELYERYHQFNLDQADIVLLKHLTIDSLFCRYCYRPFDPKSLNDVLLTPFWALSEIISIYAFPWVLYVPLLCVYGCLTALEWVRSCLNDERERENVDDYDRQYFAKEALNVKCESQKNNKNASAVSGGSSSDGDDYSSEDL